MISVMINGEDSKLNTGAVVRMTDLIELIKSTIDPDHMITAILLNGKEMDDTDWTSTTTQHGTSILEIATGTPDDFVSDRIRKAYQVIQACYFEFRDARKTFQDGNMLEGNQKLVKAVTTLRTFCEWYSSIMNLVPESKKTQYCIDTQISEISEICKRICQQQLYQSWWALGETIGKELEPKLDALEDHFRKMAAKI